MKHYILTAQRDDVCLETQEPGGPEERMLGRTPAGTRLHPIKSVLVLASC
jgi:hypothetical protein